MQVKICPVCGAMFAADEWLQDSCPCCEAKQETAPWKIVNLKEES